tara:strand:+ start:235 stop:720 length:486 start_codon:yes stop_codon:yes gene_type:complete
MNDINKDVLKNSAKQIHTHLLKQYFQKTVETEMALYIARQTRMDNKVQRYFNSSPLRNAFARWMTYAVYANRFYTITELVDEMLSNRQSISTMISECEAEGWLEVTRKANLVKCRASATLVEKMEDYCLWRKDNTRSIIGTAYNALYNFEDLVQMDLPIKI